MGYLKLQIFLFTLAFTIIFFICGCSGGSGIVVPDENTTPSESELDADNSQREIWGAWGFSFDPINKSVALVPAREILAHFDITQMLNPPACQDCLKLEILEFNFPTRYIELKLTLKNKTLLNGYDVRGIAMSNSSTLKLKNADGYTGLWDDGGAIPINPFRAFATDQPNRKFAAGTNHSRVYEMNFGTMVDLQTALLVVDVSFPGNCPEPYQISNFLQSADLPAEGGEVDVWLDVLDWQFDAGPVFIDATPIGGTLTELTYIEGYQWGGTVQTLQLNSPGPHKLLVQAGSAGTSQKLYDYANLNIAIPKCWPEGNETWQGATPIAVGENSGLQLVCLADKADWFKFTALMTPAGSLRLEQVVFNGKIDMTFYSDPEGSHLVWKESADGSDIVIPLGPLSLPPGEYFVRVRHVGNDELVRQYILHNDAQVVQCIPEGNEDFINAGILPMGTDSGAQVVCADDVTDWYKFQVTAKLGGELRLQVTNDVGACDITFYENPGGNYLLWGQAAFGADMVLDLSSLSLGPATYFIRVRRIGNDSWVRQYVLHNDAFNNTCIPEGNESWQTATNLQAGNNSGIQEVCTGDKEDWYKFAAPTPPGGSIRLEMQNFTGTIDFTLYDNPAGQHLVWKQSTDGSDLVISLEPLALPFGEYYVRVRHIGGDDGIRKYIYYNDVLTTPCEPDSNDSPNHGMVLNFGWNSGPQTVCVEDGEDWFKFTVVGSKFAGEFRLHVTNDLGSCELGFYENTSLPPLLSATASFGSDGIIDLTPLMPGPGTFFIKVSDPSTTNWLKQYTLYNDAHPVYCEADGNEDWQSATSTYTTGSTNDRVCMYDLHDWYRLSISEHLLGTFSVKLYGSDGPMLAEFYSDPQAAPLLAEEIQLNETAIFDTTPLGLGPGDYYVHIAYVGDDIYARTYEFSRSLSDTICFPDNNDSYLEAVEFSPSNPTDEEVVCPDDPQDWFSFTLTGSPYPTLEILMLEDAWPLEFKLYNEGQALNPEGPNLLTLQVQGQKQIDLNALGLTPGTYYIRLSRSVGNNIPYFLRFAPESGYQWVGYDWAAGPGTTHVSSDGTFIIGGACGSSSDLDFGPGIDNSVPNGYFNAFITSSDQEGNHLWSASWGGSYSAGDEVFCRGIGTDPQGNVYVTGDLDGTCDFDPGPGEDIQSGVNFGYLSKFDSNGIFQWARSWGKTGYGGRVRPWAIAVNQSGEIFITGIFDEEIDFDPGPGIEVPDVSSNAQFLCKYDSAGNYQWVQYYDCSSSDISWDMAISESEDIYITGYYYNNTDFDPGPGFDWHINKGYTDCYLSKYDPDGNYLWTKTWGGSMSDRASSLVLSSGNLLISGSFEGTVDFNPGPAVDERSVPEGNDVDCYIISLDSAGNYLDVLTWGGIASESADYIGIDELGRIYVFGMYGGLCDFDPGSKVDYHLTNGSYDLFLLKLNPDGTYDRVETWGGTDSDYKVGMAVSGSNVFVIGQYNGLVDFDPGTGVDEYNSYYYWAISKFSY